MFTIFAALITFTSVINPPVSSYGHFLCPAASKYIRFCTPVWSVNAPTAREVISSGKGGTVFYFAKANKFFRDMLITEKPCLNGQNASLSNRAAHETRISINHASIEDAYFQLFQSLDPSTAYTFMELAESFGGVQHCMIRTERKHAFRIRKSIEYGRKPLFFTCRQLSVGSQDSIKGILCNSGVGHPVSLTRKIRHRIPESVGIPAPVL